MTKVITVIKTSYKTSDGEEYTSRVEAEAHQNITDKVDALTYLKPVPFGLPFLNGESYVQQDSSRVLAHNSALWNIAREIPHMAEWIAKQEATGKRMESAHVSWPLRMLDGKHGPLAISWGRIMCIDPVSYREYGQPYFAAYPPANCGEV